MTTVKNKDEKDQPLFTQILIGVIAALITAGASALNITWATAKQNEKDIARITEFKRLINIDIKLLDERIDENDVRWARVEETMKWLEKYLEDQRVPRPE